MSANRPRRNVRRAVVAVAVVVLLPVWSIGAWICWPKVCDGILYGRAPTLVSAINWFFEPITWYSQTEYPGGDALSRLWWWANPEYFWFDPSVPAPVESSES